MAMYMGLLVLCIFCEATKQLGPFMDEVNKTLECMELVLKTTVEEREDGDHSCLVLVNLMSGVVNRTLSTYSELELSFLRQLVCELVTSSDGEMNMNAAINLGLTLKQKMRVSVCEKLIERLVNEKWFLKSHREDAVYLSLSSLIIAELNTYLEEIYADEIHKCFFCTQFTFKGYQCQKCEVGVHRDCAKKYWKTSKKTNSCPNCNEYLGSSSTPDGPRKRLRLPDDNDEMEEEHDEEEQEENEEMEGEEEVGAKIVTRSRGRPNYEVE